MDYGSSSSAYFFFFFLQFSFCHQENDGDSELFKSLILRVKFTKITYSMN